MQGENYPLNDYRYCIHRLVGLIITIELVGLIITIELVSLTITIESVGLIITIESVDVYKRILHISYSIDKSSCIFV